MTVTLTGTMTCPAERLETVRAALPSHVALTRQEPGCLRFNVWEDEQTSGLFHVSEEFTDSSAFAAHQARGAASDWARVTKGLPRDYKIDGLEQ